MRIFLGLGTNLGDRDANLVRAKDLLVKNGVMILGQSQVLETAPLYGVKQPDYLNQVVEAKWEAQEARAQASAEELLFICKKIEKEMGRPVDLPISNVKFACARAQSGGAWARNESRIIDIDILFYGEEKVDIKNPPLNLLVPHHGVFEREFVVSGMRELAPEFFERMRKKSTKNAKKFA